MTIVFVLGAVQGLFLAAVLAGRTPRTTPNGLLAAAMTTFSIDLGIAAYHSAGLDARLPHFIGLDAAIGFLYGPLWFLYVRTLTTPPGTLRPRDALHFAPFVGLILFLAPFYLLSGADKLAGMRQPTENPYLAAIGFLAPFKLVIGAAYIGSVLVLIRRHGRRIRSAYSTLERVQLGWVRHVTIALVVLLVVSGSLFVASGPAGDYPVGLDPTGPFDDLTLLSVTVMVYFIGYLGLRQHEILLPNDPPPEPVIEFASNPAEPLQSNKPRYTRSGMDPETARRIKDRLCALMEQEHLYRNGQLTLIDLAGALDISPHNLTEVINTQLGLNFYDFVNGYRVREAQTQLADPACAHLTVLAIGLEAGFNSKSAFNAVFKKHTNHSPSDYRAGEPLPSHGT
ncbi:MAG: AraC family transcriptional regulator [Rhodothermales bacterium]|nr:AraC family transcriptional regulator [Rhodothermales bacterium]